MRPTALKLLIVIAVGVLAGACASPRGFDRGELLSEVSPEALVTEDEIQRVLDLKPQLPRPFKLGLYFTQPTIRHWAEWRWLPEDKDRFLEIGKSLEEQGLVSETVFVSSATAKDEKLKSIRLAAARHGLDAVLVLSGVSDVDRYNNSLGPAYALLVTGLFVPGTVVDGLFVSHAGLWDVRNGFLYTSVETDGTASSTGPAAFVSEQDVVKEAKAESLKNLATAAKQRVENLAR